MRSLHVVLTKEALDARRLAGKVVIVIDVLFATTTITHALVEGADAVWPVCDGAEAMQVAGTLDAPVVAGEYAAHTLAGFAPASPLALAATGLRGHGLVYVTSNGTVALRRAASAERVYAVSLLNGAAVARHIARAHPEASVLILCAGSMGEFNMEDFFGAGHVVFHLLATGEYACTDAALAALSFKRGSDARASVNGSRVGGLMHANGLQAELEFAARCDVVDVVPVLVDGRITGIAA